MPSMHSRRHVPPGPSPELRKCAPWKSSRSSNRFELLDDFHGAHFRSSGEGPGGTCRRECIDGMAISPKRAFDGRDQVHDVRIALHEHKILDLNRAVLAHAPQIV